MPKVQKVTKSGRGKTVRCTACGKDIEKGQQFYEWQRFGSPKQCRHVACGYPRPTELSTAKTAVVVEAVEDAKKIIASWTPTLVWNADIREFEADSDADVIVEALQAVADEARSTGEEYEASADNMPESLQYGSQAEAMRAVAGELYEYADALEGYQPDELDMSDVNTQVADDMDEDEVWDALEDAAQEVLDAWVESITSEAEALLEDVPEYSN